MLGSALLPLDDWTGLALERFRSKAFAGALLTATATAGYTVLDDEALRWLRGSEALELGPTRISLVYAAFHAWVTTGTLGLWVLSRPEERGSLREVVDTLRLPAFAVGIGGYASYILVLVAMAFVDNVTYLAGFRQLSVPLAVGVGFLFLRERVSGPRLAGVALCTAGLIMIVLAS